MKTLTFLVTIEVTTLTEVNVDFLEEEVSRSIMCEDHLELDAQDEWGTSAKLLSVKGL